VVFQQGGQGRFPKHNLSRRIHPFRGTLRRETGSLPLDDT